MFPSHLVGQATVDEPSIPPGSAKLASVTAPISVDDPRPFLRAASGMPRTFWGDQRTWTATAGQATSLEIHVAPDHEGTAPVEPGPGARCVETIGPEEADQRYHRLQAMAQALLDPAVTDAVDGATERRPRAFGGLAFHPHHQATGAWDRFPSARFTVPAIELTHRPHGTTLTATVLGEPDDGQDALARANQLLDHARESLSSADPAEPDEPAHPRPAGTGHKEAWTQAVQDALAAIRAGKLDKVVLARALQADAQDPPDLVTALHRLRQNNPGAHVFCFQPAPGTCFLGAAPEIVTQVDDGLFQATAVAGSIRRGTTPDEDDRLARTLMASTKDRAEHDLVVDHVRRRLRNVSDRLEIEKAPHILRLKRIQHLETHVRARLPADAHALEVLGHLHPTPAVCGTPAADASAFLRHSEPFERGWYAGPVGWFDAQGAGTFALGLRSAVLQDRRWHLFAGAGIVDGSDPDKEWEETRIKFEPALQAIGVPEDP